MTSNTPFQVEDTDEDFFDKLVSDGDDLDFNFMARSSSLNSVGPVFGDVNESDEVKAFANLSINETSSSQMGENKFVVSHSNELEIQSNGELHDVIDEVKDSLIVDGVIGEGKSVVESAKSSEFGGVSDLNTQNVGSEDISDSNLSNGNGSGVAGVKEVQWTAFHADSALSGGIGFGSYSDFFSELGEKDGVSSEVVAGSFPTNTNTAPSTGDTHELVNLENSDLGKYQDGHNYGAGVQQNSEGQGDSIQYWESLYPGWKIDPKTGQWYQVEGYVAGSGSQGNAETVSSYGGASLGGKTEVSYFQQSFQTVGGTMVESATPQKVTNWSSGNVSLPNQVSQGTTNSGALDWNQSANEGYPSHMAFDPQYPGWYFDTIAQEWKLLEAYNLSSTLAVLPQDQSKQNGYAATSPVSMNDYQKVVQSNGQADNNGVQGFGDQVQLYNLSGSLANYNHQDSNAWQHATVGSNAWQHETVTKSEPTLNYRENLEEYHNSLDFSRHGQLNQQVSYDHGRVIPSYEEKNKNKHDFSAISTPQGNFPLGSFGQQCNQPRMNLTQHVPVSNEFYSNQNPSSFSQQLFSPVLATGRSSAGRPPHALVAFGFGGKLIIAKNDNSITTSSFGSQNPTGSSINVLNLKEVVLGTTDSNAELGASDYFHALCLQSFPGPLIGGSGGLKELNKWFDERIQNSGIHHHKGEVLRLLLSLLKLSCQYYGKLRSPIGSDTGLKESDVPEVAVARLFSSAKKNSTQFSESVAIAHCLQELPSEGQMRATAAEVQNLLVSGRKMEALHYAQEGQLWGPAIALAAQLGDQCYMETIKQMALRQLVPGSPLRTLCLLIAGQPGDVFSSDTPVNSSMLGAVNVNQQPAEFGSPRMLGGWEENLAVITANRTKGDELVLRHLGDCLWKERYDVIAAHICYLVAEADFEPYSETARLCLLGADHWKSPRTYASPEAIQRTEIFEYSKLIGNSQFTLLPFQPYKFVYAHMLAEVGRISDALKYCQAVLKSLKTGRAPEVENFRQSVAALEERIKSHQQGGFSTNLVPTKLVGKLFGLLDSAAHRVVGSLPPPVPTTPGGSPPVSEQYQLAGSMVSTSQSTMDISSLMNSASMEPITEWAADSSSMTMHNRSVSEPDFTRSPRQGQTDSSKEASSAESRGETSGGGGKSRLGRFGFGSQLLQKTVGLVLRPLRGRQAKLGEKNKFYYNEKLKSWVEEGAEPPNEEIAPPPPPTNPNFQNGLPDDYNLKAAIKSEGTLNNGSPAFKSPTAEQGSGIPPLPPTSTQYSARGRMGVRSRYVDTFNNGGANQTNLFQSPSLPSSKPATAANPKFFVPTPINTSQETPENATDSKQGTLDKENMVNTVPNGLPQSPAPPPPLTMQRFGSMGSISSKATAANSSVSAPSRRTASCGSFGEISSPPFREVKPLGEVLGMPPSNSLPSNTAVMSSAVNGVSLGDGLHEVEL